MSRSHGRKQHPTLGAACEGCVTAGALERCPIKWISVVVPGALQHGASSRRDAAQTRDLSEARKPARWLVLGGPGLALHHAAQTRVMLQRTRDDNIFWQFSLGPSSY